MNRVTLRNLNICGRWYAASQDICGIFSAQDFKK